MTIMSDRTIGAAQASLERARHHLLALQDERGYWKGELETNVTIDAEDLFLAHFLGLERPLETRRTALWIRSHQRPDGSWATFHGGPGDLSTSVEAYVALRLAGDPADAEHMTRGAEFIREAGGVESSRVFTRMWLSLLALWSWAEVPTLPPEQILLPARAPLSVYSFGCWARQTIVALSVVTALAPSAPVDFGIDELRTGAHPRQAPDDLWGRGFLAPRPGRPPLRAHAPPPLRRVALRTAERWIVERQERDGSLGRDPAALGLVDRRSAASATSSTTRSSRGRSGLETFTVDDERGRRVEACQSPVWDTALAVVALLDAGLPAGDPARSDGPPTGSSRRRSTARRLGCPPARPRPRRLPVRVRQRQLPRRRRHCSRRARAAPQRRRRRRGGRPRRALDARDAEPLRRLGGLRRRQHEPSAAPRSPSATSAPSPTLRALM